MKTKREPKLNQIGRTRFGDITLLTWAMTTVMLSHRPFDCRPEDDVEGFWACVTNLLCEVTKFPGDPKEFEKIIRDDYEDAKRIVDEMLAAAKAYAGYVERRAVQDFAATIADKMFDGAAVAGHA